jgi:hypothetical protein
VEQAADAIMAGTTDRKVRLAALQWKIEAVPALRQALFQPDPITAALDTLLLCRQMSDYFETGAGRDALGPASTQALNACRRMQEEFTRVLASGTTSGDLSKATAFATSWAAEHPVRRSIADRESALTRVYEREFTDEMHLGRVIAEVTTTADDLNRKVEVYSDQLFRQARWELERFRMEMVSELRADEAIPLVDRAVTTAAQAVATIDRLAPAVERALTVAQEGPRLIASEREAALKAMHEEVTRTIQCVHEVRVAALEQVGKERGTAMHELDEALHQQRERVMGDVDQMATKSIDYAMQRLARLMAVAMGAAFGAALLGLFLARRLFVRRPAG